MLYIIFSLLGYYVDVEVHTADGRVDLVMRTSYALYLIELKINSTADAAMAQIELKNNKILVPLLKEISGLEQKTEFVDSQKREGKQNRIMKDTNKVNM